MRRVCLCVCLMDIFLRYFYVVYGFDIDIKTNLKEMNFLYINSNLRKFTYKPYRKPNNKHLYRHISPKHTPSIIKQITETINRKLSNNSCRVSIPNEVQTTMKQP